MEDRRVCPHCERPLAADAPLGLCPECLLKSGRSPGSEAGTASTGISFEAPSIEEVRELFPQLEILGYVGRGGMGAVYKTRQPQLQRLAALKILPLKSDRDGSFAERFSREARALARLNHPNIVSIYDSGERDGVGYFLMEYVDGVNLRQLERSDRPTPEEALAIVPPICEALEYAHRQGIVHRDIKPENILIDKDRRVKIADFGIAKLLRGRPQDHTLTGRHLVGTPHYMAPEQVEKPNTVDHRADIYSLGVVFYELLTGELPLGKFAPPSQKVRIDARLDSVVLRALEKEPARRYQHASDVKTQLDSIAAHPIVSKSFQHRNALRGLVLGVTLVLLAASFQFWVWRSKTGAARRNAQQHFEPGNLGWFLAGNNRHQYETGTDRNVTRKGKPATLLKSTVPNPAGFATLMQTAKADVFRQQRVRMTGFLRLDGVSDRAGLWMRVDGQLIQGSQVAEPLAFDNMEDRPVRGTADWTPYTIVLDVPERAQEIAFGVSLAGSGKLWLADLSFEAVGKDVPTTGAKMTQDPLQIPKLDFEN